MKVEFTAAQDALRKELRSYFEQLMTPELSAECDEAMGEGGGPLAASTDDQLVYSSARSVCSSARVVCSSAADACSCAACSCAACAAMRGSMSG